MSELWEHQKQAIKVSHELQDLALFWEMGTGKTCGMINILRHRYHQNGRLLRTLVLAPLVVCQNWGKELQKFSKIKHVLILDKSGPKRLATFHKELEKNDTLTREYIVVTNYQALLNQGLLDAILTWAPEVLVLDESHTCKNHKSKIAKKIVRIADQAQHRYLLSGTPILNTPADIWMQYRILDGHLGSDATFSRNFYSFHGKYFKDENASWKGRSHYFPKYVPRKELFQDLNQRIYSKALRVTKEDCLDLPPLVKQVRQVPMTPEQTKVYTQMKRDYVAFVESKLGDGEPRAVVAQLAVTKALRLLQITSGYCKTEDGSEVSLGRTPRHKELLELLTELTPNHKVIVWACFKENYEAIKSICDEIGVGYSEIHGGTKDKEGEAERFREDAKTRVCIANQGAGGVGINLVEASYAIYFSRNFKSGDDRQSEARNHRGGSEIHRKITRIDLVTPDTIDELVLDALREKKDIANTILDWKL